MLSGHFFRALRALQKTQLTVWLVSAMVSVCFIVYKMPFSYSYSLIQIYHGNLIGNAGSGKDDC